jgi:hypothetical protein
LKGDTLMAAARCCFFGAGGGELARGGGESGRARVLLDAAENGRLGTTASCRGVMGTAHSQARGAMDTGCSCGRHLGRRRLGRSRERLGGNRKSIGGDSGGPEVVFGAMGLVKALEDAFSAGQGEKKTH